jgi:hypothetical protein
MSSSSARGVLTAVPLLLMTASLPFIFGLDATRDTRAMVLGLTVVTAVGASAATAAWVSRSQR